jgi:predicted RND superfamily exporter protein
VRFGGPVGVVAALILTFTFLPILLVRVPSAGIHAQGASETWNAALQLVIDLCRKRGRAIIFVCGLLLLICGFGISRLRVDLDERELFGTESRVEVGGVRRDHLR